MYLTDNSLRLSPSDIAAFLGCRHRTGLDLAAARGELKKPKFDDPYAAILARHGADHEQQYVASLQAEGLRCVNARPAADTPTDECLARTLEAMHRSADVIVQARLDAGGIAGYADVLRKVDRRSDLGNWSYEAYDTKLARDTKGGTILQLSAYSQMLADMQGERPEAFHVVTPVATERYLVTDYAAYYRFVRQTLDGELQKGHEWLIAENYPEPVEACQICAWNQRCEARRRHDDHLSFIAGCGRAQRVELNKQGYSTLQSVATMTTPVTFKPARGARETYDRIGNQARVQYQQKTEQRPIVERLPVEEGCGLRRLPAPSRGDLFLDLEGAAFAREGGREFLFGLWDGTTYRASWATNDAEERAAFEALADRFVDAVQRDPSAHIYHYNHYEPTAFKKLANRYVTRVEPLNQLLREERFVDLYPIVRQSVRCGVESYSIKQLEQYYGYTRRVELANVREPLIAVEIALESGAVDALEKEIRDAVQGYNEDDCRSTQGLRDWLEQLRDEAVAAGEKVPRPQVETKEPPKRAIELQQRAEDIRARLLSSIPAEASDPAHADHPTWLLAYLVDWHRREVNAEWWEYYRLRDLPEDELFDERKAVAGLQHVQFVGDVIHRTTRRPTGSIIDRYTYPSQDIDIKGRLKLQNGTTFGSVESHDRKNRLLDIKKSESKRDLHPAAAFASDPIGNDAAQESVIRIAEAYLSNPSARETCGCQLLHRQTPRLRSGAFAMRAGESEQDFAVRIATDLNRTVLSIQGPPGAGKTFIGAQMIRALVRAGKKVGVTATSHKVIHNLLDEVVRQSVSEREPLRAGHKDDGHEEENAAIRSLGDNDAPLAALQSRDIDVVGGTAWLWSREEYAAAVDVLFVDEAGQMSLANVLAVSHAADSMVLLGDPQQLNQPEKGTHPDGVGVSALEHVLGDHETMPPDRGIFLPITWRMSPTLTAFTSELFYEGKLTAKAGLERQILTGVVDCDGSKLWMIAVNHDGNQIASDEEVEVVVALVQRLLAPGPLWIDEKGAEEPVRASDIRVVAPFNAQVNRLNERLAPLGVPVGTVDKFQGQTCVVVIYSMATSRPEDAPRGLEFLYSLNRLNVATSRARCAVFVVASPLLFEPECRTPRQMKLANALCRYAEVASRLDLPPAT